MVLVTEILKKYAEERPKLEKARVSLEAEVRRFLAEGDVRIQSVSSRLKDPASLAKKLSRPDKTYHRLNDVTDLIGLRVVTFFEDTIDQVATLIERRFDVDYAHSTNKLLREDFDRFGYRSLHYVCFVNGADRDVRFEIQIRTLLQHTWAEIEHDLGYKGGDLAPAMIRRRFSRVAGLLEIADQEFVSIRDDLEAYVRSVRSRSETRELNLALDVVSLNSLVDQSGVHELDRAVADFLGKSIGSEVFFPDYLIRMLHHVGFTDVASCEQAIADGSAEIRQLIRPYFQFLEKVWKFSPEEMQSVPRGYALLLLAHHTILRAEKLDLNRLRRLAELYAAVDERLEDITPQEIAGAFLESLRSGTL